jgi:fluoride exporter
VVFWILLGSAFGGMARYWLSGTVARAFGETFPWGTLVVNVSGAFAVGVIFGMQAPLSIMELHPAVHYLLILGFLGSYTTVSSFSLQTLTLARNRQWSHALVNIVLTTILCLLAVWSGYELAVAYAWNNP